MSTPVPGPTGPLPGPPPAVPTAVTTARQRLAEVAERPLDEHVAVYDEVHRLLQDALATLDEG